MSNKTAKYRSDYRAPAFSIERVNLTIELDDVATLVRSKMRLSRRTSGALTLDGEQLKLVSVQLNGETLDADAYTVTDKSLTIDKVPDQFELEIVTELDPSANSALEGLYKSGGAFCTQCEAEGFRRITYYLDRPDVLAVFTTTVIAERERFPYLLSNGNLESTGELEQGRHYATWHDPHPKPAYLFALVAGDFDRLEDHYVTTEGRNVRLELFVDKGNLARGHYAMASLKRAMQWDEERFGLAYDLDRYMVVAVDFFNMGAMENKGLNIFNSKYVLAEPASATDWDYVHVESVIGHEYFHNWTGNRITCRDWFQLSLKEGLTVFRDQEFSSDLGSRAVHRIDAIRVMRSFQFNEDAGPMAHPIRPDKVIEMNNFYTVTVYNKGAEVIRMLHTLLGEHKFQLGMQLYRKRHDGQAVTCEDFIAAMEDANQFDLSLFRRWYSQAGTPEVAISQSYDAATGELHIKLHQQTPATPEQSTKQPVVVPLLFSAYNQAGERVQLKGASQVQQHESGSQLVVLDSETLQLTFNDVEQEPVIAWLENFSAPVKLQTQLTTQDLELLLGHAEQEVTRWEAAQQIYLAALRESVAQQQPAVLSASQIDALRAVLEAPLDNGLKALIFALPSAEELLEYYPQQAPLAAIEQAVDSLAQAVAKALASEFNRCFEALEARADDLSNKAMADRALRQKCLYFLALAKPHQFNEVVEQQALIQGNMTLQQGALEIAVQHQLPCQARVLAEFEAQWQDTPLVMDKWFAAQANARHPDTVDKVAKLLEHSKFSLRNPNRVYALLASFSRNSLRFHQADGAGYRLLLGIIKQLNTLNPQVASRLITPFMQWRRFDTSRQEMLQDCLLQLQQVENLAPDLEEKIASALASDDT
ncbi:Aminopeptidase N [Pseudidiomarina piscicola]|uniref:Aminopeptidase N n=1 Tax=Pseudidiomarina piscicola TaxID=2614830 RepID=A0A6S6WKE5_9GAMM|nr:aminopeptidase N [Pseudidiomarina piscicola]CAB0149971.1 Aminopeptidase N [Pseudidiomarina piscicola]VZT39417.1 Aminopeptidase N [Pseudomonas aeruginosa]